MGKNSKLKTKFYRFFGNSFLFLASVIICLVAFEWGTRTVLGPYTSQFEQNFPIGDLRHPYPYIMFRGLPGAAIGKTDGPIENVNNLGYRGSSPTLKKAPEEYRIFVLGGSTVFLGSIIHGKPSIPEHLENLFHKAGFGGARVFNYGSVSSVSGQELMRIIFEISNYEPDLIIMYNGGNDILSPTGWDPRPGYPFNFVAYENNPLLALNTREYPMSALLALGTNIGRHFFRSYLESRLLNTRQLRKEFGFLTTEAAANSAEIYVSNLFKAKHASASAGAGFVGYLQPVVFFKNTLSGVEEKYHVDNSRLNSHSNLVRQFIISKVKPYISKGELKFKDLSGIFENVSEEIFYDDIHTHPKWYLFIAELIFQDLLKSGVLEDVQRKGRDN